MAMLMMIRKMRKVWMSSSMSQKSRKSKSLKIRRKKVPINPLKNKKTPKLITTKTALLFQRIELMRNLMRKLEIKKKDQMMANKKSKMMMEMEMRVKRMIAMMIPTKRN